MEHRDLARRALACKHWRWMPGMLLFDGKSSFTVPISWRHGTEGQRAAPILGSPMFQNALPDLTDPATLGCLLAMVREAWGMPVAVWYPKNEEVCSVSVGRLPVVTGRHWTEATKAEALVAALEDAP